MTFDEIHKIVQDGIDGISPKIEYINMDIYNKGSMKCKLSDREKLAKLPAWKTKITDDELKNGIY